MSDVNDHKYKLIINNYNNEPTYDSAMAYKVMAKYDVKTLEEFQEIKVTEEAEDQFRMDLDSVQSFLMALSIIRILYRADQRSGVFTVDLGTNLAPDSIGMITGSSWLLALYACCASLREEPVYSGACFYDAVLMSLVGAG